MMASPKRQCMPSLSHLLHITLGKARCCHATLEPCMENCSSTVLACHFKPNPLVSSGHMIPLSSFINFTLQHRAVHLFAFRDHDRLGLICIVMVPSRFCWNHSFQINTSQRSINHRSSFMIPPSQLTYCPVFIALLPSTTGMRSASFLQRHCRHRALIYSSGNSLFALSHTSKGISSRELINLWQYA